MYLKTSKKSLAYQYNVPCIGFRQDQNISSINHGNCGKSYVQSKSYCWSKVAFRELYTVWTPSLLQFRHKKLSDFAKLSIDGTTITLTVDSLRAASNLSAVYCIHTAVCSKFNVKDITRELNKKSPYTSRGWRQHCQLRQTHACECLL